jgi:transcriptional repressor of cell division inhibition gene dicB
MCLMRKDEVLDHFKTQKAIAEALGIAQPSVAEWGEYPPDSRQLQIELLTGGTLKAEPGCMQRVLGLDKLASKAKD